jgi:hypothetical protein
MILELLELFWPRENIVGIKSISYEYNDKSSTTMHRKTKHLPGHISLSLPEK